MKEYTPQLRVSENDPACVASSLGDTIIGILFEKKGIEIKTAIAVRLDFITKKNLEYYSIVKKIEDFIDQKSSILKTLDLFYQERCDERTASLRPIQRQIQDLEKKCDDEAYKFDRQTHKKLSEKAVKFEEGFDYFKVNFDELDEFLQKEKIEEKLIDAKKINKGISGYSGISGCSGYSGSRGIVDENGEEHELYEPITKEEEKALARIQTLRTLLQKYKEKVAMIKLAIKLLEEEQRKLNLIKRHVDDSRVYKLDLNKLSAFGFEDLE